MEQQPEHVAIIMDGNRTAGRAHWGDPLRGHTAGAENVRMVIQECLRLGIRYLTLYTFSTENWSRGEREITHLFSEIHRFCKSEADELLRAGVRIVIVGDRTGLPVDVRTAVTALEQRTKHNDALVVTIALNYGGQDEILRAIRRMFGKLLRAPWQLHNGKLKELFERCLDTGNLPDVDIVIRTGGQQRLSNFLLWKVAYAELFFTDTLWPDFTVEEFTEIVRSFGQRERRYGGDGALKRAA